MCFNGLMNAKQAPPLPMSPRKRSVCLKQGSARKAGTAPEILFGVIGLDYASSISEAGAGAIISSHSGASNEQSSSHRWSFFNSLESGALVC